MLAVSRSRPQSHVARLGADGVAPRADAARRPRGRRAAPSVNAIRPARSSGIEADHVEPVELAIQRALVDVRRHPAGAVVALEVGREVIVAAALGDRGEVVDVEHPLGVDGGDAEPAVHRGAEPERDQPRSPARRRSRRPARRQRPSAAIRGPATSGSAPSTTPITTTTPFWRDRYEAIAAISATASHAQRHRGRSGPAR